ncbi:LamG-like jellyroll fold domain-containing protein [Vulgatibacter incomptus]|uniref:LamG-like jellyroll fold domain-containing protein n=1 Tax=Vulgatibacter incomptus TaxID=1391653 RepID=UPI0014700B88|nr:LamG-like jellyroll fold domain-containing protein [Vulgatibacter incomptus]
MSDREPEVSIGWNSSGLLVGHRGGPPDQVGSNWSPTELARIIGRPDDPEGAERTGWSYGGIFSGERDGVRFDTPFTELSDLRSFTVEATFLASRVDERRPVVRGDNFALSIIEGEVEAAIVSAGHWWTVRWSDAPIRAGEWVTAQLFHSGESLSVIVNGVAAQALDAPRPVPGDQLFRIAVGPRQSERGGYPYIGPESPFIGVVQSAKVWVPIGSPASTVLDLTPKADGRLPEIDQQLTVQGDWNPSKLPYAPGHADAGTSFYFDQKGWLKLEDENGVLRSAFDSTLSMWIMTLDDSPSTIIRSNHLRVWSADGILRMEVGSQGTASIGRVLERGKWHHLTFTATIDRIRAYVDGVYRMDLNVGLPSGTDEYLIGADLLGEGLFSGYIEQVRMWDHIRIPRGPIALLEFDPWGAPVDYGRSTSNWTHHGGYLGGPGPSKYEPLPGVARLNRSTFRRYCPMNLEGAHTLMIDLTLAEPPDIPGLPTRVPLWQGGNFSLGVADGRLRLIVDGTETVGTIPFEYGVRAEVVVVFDGWNAEVYVNGELDSRARVGRGWFFGMSDDCSVGGFDGLLFRAGYWNEAVRPVDPINTHRALLAGALSPEAIMLRPSSDDLEWTSGMKEHPAAAFLVFKDVQPAEAEQPPR